MSVVAVAVAFALDALVAEPPRRGHPVAWFGTVVARFDRDWTHPRAAGAVVAVAFPMGAALVAAGSVALLDGFPAVVLAGGWVFVATSRRMLVETAREVLDHTATDTVAARTAIRSLVGRDTGTLSAAELRSATVESAAENLADGLVAPLFAFAVGSLVSLPVATAGAVFVKAVNTLDSMLGYPQHPHGAASARLDDAVMLVPARVTAGLIALVALAPDAVTRADAHATASPNSGWPMGTLAAATDVRLEKPGVYVLNETAALPTDQTARRGVRVVDRAGVLAFALTGVVAWF